MQGIDTNGIDIMDIVYRACCKDINMTMQCSALYQIFNMHININTMKNQLLHK
jgi:hypothetical protein